MPSTLFSLASWVRTSVTRNAARRRKSSSTLQVLLMLRGKAAVS
jgi:hypothetical protein